MKTFRMVAETPDGQVVIDVVLRGEKLDAAESEVRSWLNFKCGFAGYLVDTGTERDTYTVAIQSDCPFGDCRHRDLCKDAEICIAAEAPEL